MTSGNVPIPGNGCDPPCMPGKSPGASAPVVKALTGQIFHNESFRYLMVEVRSDRDRRGAVPIGYSAGHYGMVISRARVIPGKNEIGQLWSFPAYRTWKVVEDVWFREISLVFNPVGDDRLVAYVSNDPSGVIPPGFPCASLVATGAKIPPGIPFVARVYGRYHEQMLIKSMDGHFFGMDGCFVPSGRIMWEKRPVFHEFVWSESLFHVSSSGANP